LSRTPSLPSTMSSHIQLGNHRVIGNESLHRHDRKGVADNTTEGIMSRKVILARKPSTAMRGTMHIEGDYAYRGGHGYAILHIPLLPKQVTGPDPMTADGGCTKNTQGPTAPRSASVVW
jgi:hypothetical protein